MQQALLDIFPTPDIELICGDCREVMKGFEPDCVDLTVTSPPYDNLRAYNDRLVWNWDVFTGIAKQLYRVTKKGGVVVWVVGDATIKGSETGTSFRQALYFKEIGFNLHDTMIWHKPNALPDNSKTRLAGSFEYIFIFCKDMVKTFHPILIPCAEYHLNWANNKKYFRTRNRKKDNKTHHRNTTKKAHNILEYNIGMHQGDKFSAKHPAPFPEKLVSDMIVVFSEINNIVFDPMMGSGTTGKMARILNRNFIGIEKDPEYFEIARDRIG